MFSGIDTVEVAVAVLAVIDHSRFIPIPSPDKIIESRIFSSSGDKGIKVPSTIDFVSGDVSTTCSGWIRHCNKVKFPLPKYTICKSIFFIMSSCRCESVESFRLLHNIPLLRCTNTCFSTSRHNPNSVRTSPLHPSWTLSNQLSKDNPLHFRYVEAILLK